MFDVGIEVVGGMATHVGGETEGWQAIDRRMRRLARKRAALDAEEAELLVAAKRAEVHKHLGYGSFGEYLERICGYAPTTARDRMRVAEALEALPATRAALASGEITFSAVRELTRVATPDTEEHWITAIAGCTAREVEHAVRGHAVGDLPDHPPDPDLEPRVLRLELPPAVYALFLEARRAMERRTGAAMTDADFIGEACRLALDGGDATPDDNQPRYQIAISVCPDCQRGWEDSGAASVELAPASIARVRCDAVELGRVDGDTIDERARTIPAPVRRAVLARDHHRCTIPGCTSSVFVDLHHLQPWSAGGEHTCRNLTTLCGLHHDAAHDGRIRIAGNPGTLSVTHADGRPYGTEPWDAPTVEPAANVDSGATRTATTALQSARRAAGAKASSTGAPDACLATSAVDDARGALTGLGFRPAEANAAVARAAAHVGATATLEELIRAALRECPRPAS